MDRPDWPRHLQASWQICAERGEVDAQNQPDSIVEAYLQVAEAQRRRWAGIPWGSAEDGASGDLLQGLATCARCAASNLEHFYTSRQSDQILCAGCYAGRVIGVALRKDWK